MAAFTLKTFINAPIEHCFDLARSIDHHLQSMESTGEKAISGKRSGLINLNDSVTWKAKHFGIDFEMTSKITAMVRPNHFIDEMTKGPFKKLHHTHVFKAINSGTEMIDIFVFKAPFGFIGLLVEKCFLKKYMINLLSKRNQVLKLQAESLNAE